MIVTRWGLANEACDAESCYHVPSRPVLSRPVLFCSTSSFMVLFFPLASSRIVPSRFVPCCLHCAYRKMGESESLFKVWFQPRLESQLSRTPSILPDRQNGQLKRWAEVLTESNESLKRRSKQRRSVRSRARNFAKNVHAIAADLFVLCSLSFAISVLPSIPDGSFYDYLRNWWTTQVPTALFTENIRLIGQGKSSAIEANQDSFPASAPQTEPRNFAFRSQSGFPEILNNSRGIPERDPMNVDPTGKSNTFDNSSPFCSDTLYRASSGHDTSLSLD